MMLQDLISRINDSYQEIEINMYSYGTDTRRKWTIPPHKLSLLSVPNDILRKNVSMITPFCGHIIIDVED